MLARQLVRQYAAGQGIAMEVADQEVVLHYALAFLNEAGLIGYRADDDAPGPLLFKGGTALRKCVFRFNRAFLARHRSRLTYITSRSGPHWRRHERTTRRFASSATPTPSFSKGESYRINVKRYVASYLTPRKEKGAGCNSLEGMRLKHVRT